MASAIIIPGAFMLDPQTSLLAIGDPFDREFSRHQYQDRSQVQQPNKLPSTSGVQKVQAFFSFLYI
jgi:hypothetical protein